MNLVKHVLFILLLDAGAALVFAHHDTAPDAGTALPLCPTPGVPGQYSLAEPDLRSTRAPMELVHETK